MTIRQALEALDLDVLLIIAAAIGLGGVVESSGLAAEIASVISNLAEGSGPVLALIALLVGTTILTEVVTNVASYWRLGLPLVVLWVAVASVLVPVIW